MSPRARATAAPVGGPLITPTTLALAALAALAGVLVLLRFWRGLGAVTALSDGYPWGLWIAYDVVTGTAIACGGYAMALLVYVLNRGRYERLVRPAVLTSALGYTMAGASVAIDVGRPWNAYKIPWPGLWNRHSVLLEVALCIFAYTLVQWIELAPALLERARRPWLRRAAALAERALPPVLALGVLLPTMHQSSLGSLLLIARTKVHPLWHTPFLPLLFLLSVVGMGYAIVVVEAVISSRALGRRPETALLSRVAAIIPWLVGAWLLLRLGDLAARGRLSLVFTSGRLSYFFVLELGLMAAGALTLWHGRGGPLPLWRQFRGAALLLAGGALYRFDAFLVAFDPGPGWHYFPAVPEILITVGIVAFELLAYVIAIKRFPILTGERQQGARA